MKMTKLTPVEYLILGAILGILTLIFTGCTTTPVSPPQPTYTREDVQVPATVDPSPPTQHRSELEHMGTAPQSVFIPGATNSVKRKKNVRMIRPRWMSPAQWNDARK